MNDFQRDFKGVWIPKNVWLDNRLTMLEKGILIEIDSLDSDDNGCFATNAHLADFCQCSETKVSGAISKLIDLKYIYVKKFDGRTRELKSNLTKSVRQTYKNCEADLQKVRESNTNENNINIIIKNIVGFLNSTCGTSYKPTTPKTQTLIKARLNEHFTENDFKTVISKMSAQWKGTEMEKYLRPETLFGTKFESYLNAKVNEKPKATSREYTEREYTQEEMSEIFQDINNFDNLEW